MGYETPMAISTYLGGLIALLLVYPFALVTVNIAIYAPKRRKHVTKWLNIASLIIALTLFTLHMQTEVIYGKELIDKYYRDNPQALVEAQHKNDANQ